MDREETFLPITKKYWREECKTILCNNSSDSNWFGYPKMFRISVIKSSSSAFQAACPLTSANFANAGINLILSMKSNSVKLSEVYRDKSRTFNLSSNVTWISRYLLSSSPIWPPQNPLVSTSRSHWNRLFSFSICAGSSSGFRNLAWYST